MSSVNPKFIVNLSEFANNVWPHMRIGHSILAQHPKYRCANPEGQVDNSECPDDEPLCNCPCQELMPNSDEQVNRIQTEYYASAPEVDGFVSFENIPEITKEDLAEPTEEEIEELRKSISECDLIKSELSDEWLGCLWSNQDHPSSCCYEEYGGPCVGPKFKDYIEYTRTSSTFWDTPKTTPLWRHAQMSLLNAQKCLIVINGDFTLKPGTVIEVHSNEVDSTQQGSTPSTESSKKRFSGRWLINSIEHICTVSTHRMAVALTRDSSFLDPNEGDRNPAFDWL